MCSAQAKRSTLHDKHILLLYTQMCLLPTKHMFVFCKKDILFLHNKHTSFLRTTTVLWLRKNMLISSR